ncbi:extracellular solute-binding protein [Sphingomonas profundi]|uniref:extracellular solute-binding protein n=1 Tax=Alterirhizorhabdus profundi TaxID=2681549 RepID=UPI0018D09842|nr:extracellular solute-binding protein [Sphingomonas profundi]
MIAGAAAAALAAGGCVGRGDRPGLTLWAMSYEGDYAPHLMPAFTAATGIPVEVQSLPWTAAHEKLLTAHAGGSLPDVIMLPNGWVSEFAMIGAIAAVRDPSLIGDMFPGVLDTIRFAGQAHAVPWSVAPQVQFFRRDLLARAGYDAPATDWDGWRAMGRRLKALAPDNYAFLMLLNWWDALFTFIGQTGARPLREHDTLGAFRQPAIREALAYYVSLFDEGLAPRVLSTEVQDPLAAFAQGYFAIYPYGPALLLDLRRRAAEIPPHLWGVARMPGPHGPGAASGVAASLAVTRTTPQPDQAWALVRHLTSIPSELRFQHLIGNLPARVSAWRDPQLATPAMAPFAAQMREPAAGPPIVEWERILAEVQLIAERVVRRLLTIDQGLAEMDRRVDALLAKRRALVAAGRIA